jgi:glutamate-1-semialdehyde 2,1-aminomutase
MYQAGTLSGNPLAMTAGLATLQTLFSPGVFDAIVARTETLVDGMVAASARAGIPLQAASSGTMFGFYFLKEKGNDITDYATAKEQADTERYGRFFQAMLDRGFYFAPSQFEAGFMSSAHTGQDVEATVAAAAEVLALI